METSDPTELEIRKLDLERYKARLDFKKFIYGSVCAAIAIAAIPPLFQLATAVLEYTKSKAERLAQQEQFRETFIKGFLDKAVSQDIELRIRFAQYFSHVSTEPDFQLRWQKYEDDLRQTRDDIRKKINDLEDEYYRKLKSGQPAEIAQLERTLSWAYQEVGYVEQNRSLTEDPRTKVNPTVQLAVDAAKEVVAGQTREVPRGTEDILRKLVEALVQRQAELAKLSGPELEVVRSGQVNAMASVLVGVLPVSMKTATEAADAASRVVFGAEALPVSSPSAPSAGKPQHAQ